MKLLFKITPASAWTLIKEMGEESQNEHYASFGKARPSMTATGEVSLLAVEWTTTGGNRYVVCPENGVILFIGSRTSFANGAGFGGVCKEGKTGYRVYTRYWSAPLILSKMETSWIDVHGWDDPFRTEAELIFAQEQEALEEIREEDGLLIEQSLAA
ncbi:MAG: hypothetical protein ACXW0T_08830 [Methylobacter sp.]